MLANRRDIPPMMEINHEHEDGNKQRNLPDNLTLVTRTQNVVHAIRVLKRKPKAQNGEANAMAKVTAAQVAEIKALAAAKALPQREIAKRYGVTQSAVSAIVTGKSWSA
jgi:predicted XRE-type DNA-binding protein